MCSQPAHYTHTLQCNITHKAKCIEDFEIKTCQLTDEVQNLTEDRDTLEAIKFDLDERLEIMESDLDKYSKKFEAA